MDKDIREKAIAVNKKRKRRKRLKWVVVGVLFLLFILYLVISVLYTSWGFTIMLDRNLYYEKGIIIYDDPTYKVYRSELFAESLESFDNMSGKWLPPGLEEHEGGSNNGDNYVSYTFFVENTGENVSDYWYEVNIENVIKNVDEAIRIKIFRNGEETTFAKMGRNGRPEPETEPFKKDDWVMMEQVKHFSPGDIDKYTVVIWLEGRDPDCTDNLIGGHIKISMQFNSELIEK